MTDTRTVRLIGVPVDLLVRGQEHSEDLRLEFALIAASDSDSVPARVISIADSMRNKYAGAVVAPQETIDNAVAAGRESVDVEYHVPPEARQSAEELAALYEEADEFCRRGDMLTLATPAEAAQLRQWFFGEFMRQIDGEPPIPWDDYRQAAQPA